MSIIKISFDGYKNAVKLGLMNKLGKMQGEKLYNSLNDSFLMSHFEVQESLIDSDINLFINNYNVPEENINEKVKEKLLYIKEQYIDTSLMNPDLADAMKYLVDTYLDGKSDQFLDLLPKEPEPIEEKKKSKFELFMMYLIKGFGLAMIIRLIFIILPL